MSPLSLNANRRRSRPEPTVQYLSFRLHQEWFALPLAAIQKVVSLDKISGDPTGRGIGLVRVEEREILVMDVGRIIFRFASTPSEETPERYLLILTGGEGEDIGLPIDSRPSLRRLPATDFAPLPPAYKIFTEIRCISSRAAMTEGEPALFLLDVQQLLEAVGIDLASN